MDPSLVVNLVVGLGGVGSGVLVAYISMRKMPSDIKGTESITMRNILESNKMLSEDNKQMREDNNKVREEMDQIKAMLTGTYEFRATIKLANPPHVVDSDISLMDQSERA